MVYSGRRPPDSTELLVQLDAECPACGKREARRIAKWRLKLYEDEDPDRLCETIHCKCGAQYHVKTRAYQNAS